MKRIRCPQISEALSTLKHLSALAADDAENPISELFRDLNEYGAEDLCVSTASGSESVCCPEDGARAELWSRRVMCGPHQVHAAVVHLGGEVGGRRASQPGDPAASDYRRWMADIAKAGLPAPHTVRDDRWAVSLLVERGHFAQWIVITIA